VTDTEILGKEHGAASANPVLTHALSRIVVLIDVNGSAHGKFIADSSSIKS
jgi:hypothetical protein